MVTWKRCLIWPATTHDKTPRLRARIKAHAPTLFNSHQRRSFILRAFRSRAGQRAGSAKKRGPTTGKGYVILDNYTINMPDGLSGVVASINMSAMTPYADMYGCNDLVQTLYDGANMSDDMIQSLYECRASIVNLSDAMYVSQLLLGKTQHLFAVRTPSSKNSISISRLMSMVPR